MKAGALRHRLILQESVKLPDGISGVTETWSDVAPVRAAVWPITGKEAVENLRLQAEVTHRVRIRYRAGVTADMRFLFGSRVLEIKSTINKDERNRELTLVCREVL